MKQQQLESVVKFLYHGEISISQDSIIEFMTVAKDLQINGISYLNENEDEIELPDEQENLEKDERAELEYEIDSYVTSFQDALRSYNTSPKRKLAFHCTRCEFSGPTDESLKKHESFFHFSSEIESEQPQSFQLLGDTRNMIRTEDSFSLSNQSKEKNTSSDESSQIDSGLLADSFEEQETFLPQGNEIGDLKNYVYFNNKQNHLSSEDLPLGCTDCDFVAKNLQEYYIHSKNTHLALVDDIWKLRCKCTQCDRDFYGWWGLKQHSISKHEARKLHCNQCSFTTTRKDSLKGHIMLVHEKRGAYNCEKCSFKCMRPGAFKSHIFRFHTDS